MLDLDTFIIIVYVLVDDWYREHLAPYKSNRGRPARLSDSEMLTLAILSEWRAGVSWQSERSFLRYMHRHYSEWFPHLPQRSAFNERKRYLFGVLLQLQRALADQLSGVDDLYECVDCLPLPAGTLGQYQRDHGHWLWESTIGRGPQGWFWGDHLLAAIRPCGVVSGWLVGAAHINDRWLLEAFLSTRAGYPQLMGPPPRPRAGHKAQITPPVGFIGAGCAVGPASGRDYLADQGFNGERWRHHWYTTYQAQVFSVPPNTATTQRPWSRQEKLWLAHHRQIVETTFALLHRVFDIKHLQAHSRWGQYTRIAAKIVGHHLGIWINRLLGRSALTHETLLC